MRPVYAHAHRVSQHTRTVGLVFLDLPTTPKVSHCLIFSSLSCADLCRDTCFLLCMLHGLLVSNYKCYDSNWACLHITTHTLQTHYKNTLITTHTTRTHTVLHIKWIATKNLSTAAIWTATHSQRDYSKHLYTHLLLLLHSDYPQGTM